LSRKSNALTTMPPGHPTAQGKVQFWGNISRFIIKYGEYPAYGCHCQPYPYSVGGSSGAADRYQYCSSLLSVCVADEPDGGHKRLSVQD